MKVHTTVLTRLALSLPPAAAAQTRTAADCMAVVEGATSPAGPNGGLTIAELMARFNVPGVGNPPKGPDTLYPAPLTVASVLPVSVGRIAAMRELSNARGKR